MTNTTGLFIPRINFNAATEERNENHCHRILNRFYQLSQCEQQKSLNRETQGTLVLKCSEIQTSALKCLFLLSRSYVGTSLSHALGYNMCTLQLVTLKLKLG
jgi:hypothetical protein